MPVDSINGINVLSLLMKDRLENRIYTYSEYNKRKYGTKAYRVGLSTRIPCPHRVNNGGCIFCNPLSFIDTYQNSTDIIRQIDEGIKKIEQCCGSGKMIAYFQDETSTAGNIDFLKDKFITAISHPKISGLIISTRPDYINQEIIKLLKSLDTDVTVEIGMQSIFDESLRFLNRGHTHADTKKAIDLLGKNGIRIGVHIILGIPNENIKNMIETAKYISGNPYIREVKIHNLVPYYGTKYGEMILQNRVKPYLIKEHINNLAEIIPYIRGDITISRLFTSNIRNTKLNILKFEGNKTKWMNELRKLLIKRDIFQGSNTEIKFNKDKDEKIYR